MVIRENFLNLPFPHDVHGNTVCRAVPPVGAPLIKRQHLNTGVTENFTGSPAREAPGAIAASGNSTSLVVTDVASETSATRAASAQASPGTKSASQ
jgi:hypothetical protein